MRPPTAPLLRSWLHPVLAFVLTVAFGLRAAATPAALGCMMGDTSSTAHGHSGQHGHESGNPDSSPPPCVCIAHVTAIGLAVESPRLIAAVSPSVPLDLPPVGDIRPIAGDRYILPFAIGPPTALA